MEFNSRMNITYRTVWDKMCRKYTRGNGEKAEDLMLQIGSRETLKNATKEQLIKIDSIIEEEERLEVIILKYVMEKGRTWSEIDLKLKEESNDKKIMSSACNNIYLKGIYPNGNKLVTNHK